MIKYENKSININRNFIIILFTSCKSISETSSAPEKLISQPTIEYNAADGYELYTFDRGSLIDENGDFVSHTLFPIYWDFNKKCFINIDGEPVVYCSLVEVKSIDGTFSLSFANTVLMMIA